MTVRVLLLLSVTAGWAFAARPRVPSPTKSSLTPTLDRQLLDELKTDPLETQIDRQLFAPGDALPGTQDPPAGRTNPALQSPDGFNRELFRQLGPAAVPEDGHPLLEITRQMRQVEGLIGQSDSGPRTQDLENRIVADLEELIERARRCCRQCKAAAGGSQPVTARRPARQPGQKKPGGSKAGSKPARNPNAAPGTSDPQRPDMDEMVDVLKDLWGHLPDRARQQMLELPVEEFLPKYELLIEEYFRRLAEEQRGMRGE